MNGFNVSKRNMEVIGKINSLVLINKVLRCFCVIFLNVNKFICK